MNNNLLADIQNGRNAARASGRQFQRTLFARKTAPFLVPAEPATSFWSTIELPVLDDAMQALIKAHGTKDLRREGDEATAEAGVGAVRVKLLPDETTFNIAMILHLANLSNSAWAARILSLNIGDQDEFADVAGDEFAAVAEGKLPKHAAALLNAWPKEETQWEAITAYRGAASVLGPADELFYVLRNIPRVKTKLAIVVFKTHFTARVSHLHSDMDEVIAGIDQICASDQLPQVLAVIYVIFHLLNHEKLSSKHEDGFRLSWLPKIAETKSFKDDNFTFFDLVFEHIQQTRPDIASFPSQLGKLEGLAKQSQNKVLIDFARLQNGLNTMRKELEDSAAVMRSTMPPPDVSEAETLTEKIDFADSATAKRELRPLLKLFCQQTQAFHDEAALAVDALREKEVAMLHAVSRLNMKFGEPSTTEMGESVASLAQFVESYKTMAESYKKMAAVTQLSGGPSADASTAVGNALQELVLPDAPNAQEPVVSASYGHAAVSTEGVDEATATAADEPLEDELAMLDKLMAAKDY